MRPLPDGDILGFSPPLIVTEAEVGEIVDRCSRAVAREVEAIEAEGLWKS